MTNEIKEAIDQLIYPLAGSWREFAVVTGSTLVSFDTENFNRMRVKVKRGYCSNKAQMFDLYVDARDLYCVDFLNRKGEVIDRIDGVYFDELERVFREHTAMQTRMPKVFASLL